PRLPPPILEMNKKLRRVSRTAFAFAGAWVSLMCTDGTLGTANAQVTVGSDGKGPKVTDWNHWRGPLQNGQSMEKGLPTTFSVDGENLVWRKEEYATRATPVIMNGRLYTVCRHLPDTNQEGEKTVCIDAKTGALLWESIHNIYLSDAPSERVGWSSVVADPETDRVFVLGLGCTFQCLDGKTGKTVWEHSMLEEYGMLSTYGGRTNFPTVFEDLVIISGVMTGWDQTAIPGHRIVAFDKNSGAAVWLTSTRVRPEDTTYSTPIYTVLNGQAAMVLGAADGALYAMQPRTGKVIWKYQASPRGLNVAPLIDDGIVYMGHGEQNETDRTLLGAVFALNGNTSGDIAEDKLLWKQTKRTVSRACPVKVGNRIFFIDDGGAMFGVNAKTGEVELEKKLGRIMFGSPVVSEGKIYVGENTGRIWCLEPTETEIKVLGQMRLNDSSEVFGSFAISDGRLYLPTSKALYCLGLPTPASAEGIQFPPQPVEPAITDTKIAHIQVCPVEMLLQPGKAAKLQVRGYNAAGQFLRLVPEATVTVEAGGSVSSDQVFTAGETQTGGAVMIQASLEDLKSTARARVIPALPWSYDFEDKKVPIQWIGMAYRHQPIELPTGGNGLAKVSTIPRGTRSQGFLGLPKMHDYTVQAEFYALDTKNNVPTNKLPDMGVVNSRYTLALEGAQRLQIRSWVSQLEQRFAVTIPFEWQAKTWYVLKFRSETSDGKITLRGKVWKKGEPEPEAWTIEGTDATPNLNGSPGLFGNSTDSEFYLDNVVVTPNS
ncbi:MAG: PQQ-binding-like beta-propeller repeat protein, partial [Pirellula sp.]